VSYYATKHYKLTYLIFFSFIYRFDAGRYKTRVFFSQEDIGSPSQRSGPELFNGPDRHMVVKTIFHPMYRHGRFHYDIAVLELEVEIQNFQPIKIYSTSNPSK